MTDHPESDPRIHDYTEKGRPLVERLADLCDTARCFRTRRDAIQRITELERRLAAAEKVVEAAQGWCENVSVDVTNQPEMKLIATLAEWERGRNG